MTQLRGLMLWIEPWLTDTGHLTRCERGTYLDLLILMWRTPGCRVPNDDVWLGKHMRMSDSEVANELRPLIKDFCQSDGNWVWQKRLQSEYYYTRNKSRRQSARAKHRWDKEKEQCPGNATTGINPAMPTGLGLGHEERKSASRSTRSRPRKPLPENWQPEDLGWGDDLDDFQRFADHARANGRLCADWSAAWRNWKRKSVQLNRKEATNGRSGSLLDAIDRADQFFASENAPESYRELLDKMDQRSRQTDIRRLPPR